MRHRIALRNSAISPAVGAEGSLKRSDTALAEVVGVIQLQLHPRGKGCGGEGIFLPSPLAAAEVVGGATRFAPPAFIPRKVTTEKRGE